ncbi:MAG TPA: hypothetical protein VJ951_12265 [Bacteroidales bacterium]|nr:hypothetical protein [Bacteroidales bacterium]
MRKIIILITLLGIMYPGSSMAENTEEPGTIMINLNADAFAGLEFGYQHPIGISDFNFNVYAKTNFPLFLTLRQQKLDTWETKFGARSWFVEKQRFLLIGDLNLFFMRHKQVLGTFIPVGLKTNFTPAIKTKSGYIGCQIGYKQILGTHIAHSEQVKESYNDIRDINGNTYKSEPGNGWYALTGNSINLGLEAKYAFSEKIDIRFDIGMIQYISAYTEGFDSMMYGQVPFYMDLQFKFRL